MRTSILLSAVILLLATPALADIPNPCCLTSLDGSQRILLIPDNDGTNPSSFGTFTVTVRNSDCAPVAGALVEVVMAGRTTGRIRTCGDAVMSKYADAQGVAVFNIPGGGCHKGPGALDIWANHVQIRNFQVAVSPDYAGMDNAGMANMWSLSITAMDFAAFGQAFGAGGSSCHDYDNNGTTGASDLSIFGQVWMGGLRACSP